MMSMIVTASMRHCRRAESKIGMGEATTPRAQPHLCVLTAFCRSPSSFFRGPAREMSPSQALSPHRNVRLSV